MSPGLGLGLGLGLNRNKGGGVSTPAQRYLADRESGIAIVATGSPSMAIKDAANPANNFSGAPSLKITTVGSACWYFDKDGVLKQCALNESRYLYDPITRESLGLADEPGRSNRALWSRDLTNAVWSKTNVTAAKNQTGLDGVANAASSITATADNATILQAITAASGITAQSAFVRRLSGVGKLEMTMDNGSTWTDVTPPASGLSLAKTPAQTLANPTVGFRIGTSGDSFFIDLVQNENGEDVSSPMVTTSTTFTRATDQNYMLVANTPFDQTKGTLYIKGRTLGSNANARHFFQIDDGTNNNRFLGALSALGGGQLLIATGGVTQANVLPGVAVPAKQSIFAATWEVNNAQAALDGALGTQDTSVTLPTVTTLRIGGGLGGAGAMRGTIAELVYVPATSTAGQLQTYTTSGWLGSDPVVNVLPNVAAIEDSDYTSTLTKTDIEVSLVRPIVFSNYEYATPGWLRHFNFNGSSLVIHLYNAGLVSGTKNGVGAILVDGVFFQNFMISDAVGVTMVRLDFGSSISRHIEVLMPYGQSVRMRGLTIPTGTAISAPTSRLSLPKAVVIGDSRRHGYQASGIATHGFHLLCRAKGWQHVNLAYGSRRLTTSDGTVLGQANPAVAFSTFDYNNRTDQTPLASFKANYKTLFANFRAQSAAKLYVVSSNPIAASSDTLPITMADYQQATQDAVTEYADANVIFIDGRTLNTLADAVDGVHLGDAGNAAWASNIAPLVSV